VISINSAVIPGGSSASSGSISSVITNPNLYASALASLSSSGSVNAYGIDIGGNNVLLPATSTFSISAGTIQKVTTSSSGATTVAINANWKTTGTAPIASTGTVTANAYVVGVNSVPLSAVGTITVNTSTLLKGSVSITSVGNMIPNIGDNSTALTFSEY
jgi:hypothetical protein